MSYRLTPSGALHRFVTHSTTLLLAFALASCSSDSLAPPLDFSGTISGQLVVSPASLTIQNGANGAFRVLLRTDTGQELASFPGSGNVTWRSDRPAIASVNGDGSIGSHLPGTAQISATVGGQTATALVTVEPKPDALRPLLDGAGEAPVGSALDSIGVRLIDEGGLPVSGVTVSFAVEVGGGTVSPSEVKTSADGTAKVLWRLGADPGDNAVRVSAPGVPDTYLRAVGRDGTDRLTLRVLGGDRQGGEVGELLGSDLVVQVVDEHGVPVPNSSVIWEFMNGHADASSANSEAGAQLIAANANAAGVTRIRWRLGQDAGDQLAVARLDNDYEVWFKADARAGKPFLVQVKPSSVDLGIGSSMRLSAEVRDRYGNLTQTKVRWSAADPSVASIGSTSGQLHGVAAGSTTIEAKAGGRAGTAGVRVVAAGPGSLRLVSGANQEGQAGTRLDAPITVEVSDASGNPMSNAAVSWAVVKGTGSLSEPVTETDAQGRASVLWTLGSEAGTQQISAASGALSPVLVAANATAGSVRQVQITPNVATISLGENRQYVATPVDAEGNPLTGVGVSWSSTNPAVAQVSASGLVTAIGAGSAQIQASAGGIVGTSSLTVTSAVSRLEIVADSTSFNRLGGQIAFRASAYDASGGNMSSTGTSWTSRDPSVATVDQLGRMVSKMTGSTLLVACLVAACDSVPVEVNQLVANVVVTAPAASVEEGSSVQFTAQAKDPGGVTVQGVSFEWASSNASVLTVNNNGLATGVTPGAVTVSATASVVGAHTIAGPDMTGQAPMTVLAASAPPPPPPGGGVLPDLPRSTVNTAYQAPTGNTIRVRQGDDLQAALDRAQPGDMVLLDANAVFVGEFKVKPRQGSGWITLTTDTQLPAPGTRVTPATAASFAKIISPSANPALWVRAGASQWRIMGVEVTTQPTAPLSWVTFKLGDTGQLQDDLSEVPRDIILDRVYVHGQPNLHTKRCVEMNASPSAVIDSYLSMCHARGQDSQAILGWNAPGPFLIENNYLEGAGENVMFGGADPSIVNLIPSDITVIGNHLFKPLSWHGGEWAIKNHFELKLGRRVLLEGNVLENNWAHAQSGFSVVLQSLNENGSAPWSVVEHVTIRYNLLRNSAQGINMLARFKGTPAQLQNNVLIEHNVLDRMGSASSFGGPGRNFQLLNDVHNVTIRNNTGFSGQATMLFEGSEKALNFVYQNNLTVIGQYGIIGGGKGEGTAALDHYTPGYVFTNNVLVRARGRLYPTGNHFPSDISAVGFVDAANGNYQLMSGSPYGTTGADIAGLNSRIAGIH